MNNTEYTSNLLCHFVGRSLPTEEAQYKLLLKIINQDLELYADIEHPENNGVHARQNMNYLGERLGELYTFCACVCFCDIPNSSLDIHSNKYSRFGIAFSKSFLISQGARPVTYIPENYNMEGFMYYDTHKSPYNYYIGFMHQLNALVVLLTILDRTHPFKEQLEEFFKICPASRETVEKCIKPIARELNDGGMSLSNLISQINGAWLTQCAYIKVFDEALEKNDSNNFYMEREWRALHNVKFSLQNIDTVYLPNESYLKRFKTDVPEYHGEFFLFDSIL